MSLFQKIVRLFQSKPTPTPINDDIRIRVELLFPPNEQTQVITILEFQCGYNLPGLIEPTSEALLERIRLSVLKVSDGSLFELFSAVKLAKYDWREVLTKAGHVRTWMPKKKWQ
jgi:hypothetical protein